MVRWIYENEQRKIFKSVCKFTEPEREQVIAIIDNKTYSWNIAYNEISNGTELGKKILKKLEALELL